MLTLLNVEAFVAISEVHPNSTELIDTTASRYWKVFTDRGWSAPVHPLAFSEGNLVALISEIWAAKLVEDIALEQEDRKVSHSKRIPQQLQDFLLEYMNEKYARVSYIVMHVCYALYTGLDKYHER